MREAGRRLCVLIGGFYLLVFGCKSMITSYVAKNMMNKPEDQVCLHILDFSSSRMIPYASKCQASSNIARCAVLSNAVSRGQCQMNCETNCLSGSLTLLFTIQVPTLLGFMWFWLGCRIIWVSVQNKIDKSNVPFVYNMVYHIDKSNYTNNDMQADIAAGASFSGSEIAQCHVYPRSNYCS